MTVGASLQFQTYFLLLCRFGPDRLGVEGPLQVANSASRGQMDQIEGD